MNLRNTLLLLLLVVLMGATARISHHSLSGLYNDDHPQYVRKDGTRPLQADWDAGSYTITAQGITVTDIEFSGQLTSTVSTGTSPFIVASTTLVSNLNADLWDGYQFADYLDQAVKTTSSPTFATLTTTAGRVKDTTRVTTTYTVLTTDNVVFCNTDSAGYTVTLPAGAEGQTFRIINSGSSANTLTVAPDGTEHLVGVNASTTLADGEFLLLTYSTTDGWY